jgi:hypothetical protein
VKSRIDFVDMHRRYSSFACYGNTHYGPSIRAASRFSNDSGNPTTIRRFPSKEYGKMVRYAAAPVAKMFLLRSYVINHGSVTTRF